VPSGGDSFPAGFDQHFELSGGTGNEAFFGRNVLRGLVEGIHEHVASHEARRSWRRQPALIGCSPWCTDDELLLALQRLHVCVVIKKWPRKMSRGLERLDQFNQHRAGLPLRAFPDLALHAPRVDGAPAVIGPGGPDNDIDLSPFRTIGFRRIAGRGGPMAHAKLALLGDLWHHDEGAEGEVGDFVGFSPRRLWVSSANFTYGSRGHLESGFWTDDEALVQGAERFIVALIGASEQLQAESDTFEPDLAENELDMEAIAEYAAEFGTWGDEDDAKHGR
jgi:hypothetical protein